MEGKRASGGWGACYQPCRWRACVHVGAESRPGVTTLLSACDEAGFRAAIAKGGNVKFAVDCPSIALTQAVTIGSGLTVAIDANGHTVTLDGQNHVRLFVVQGGKLTIDGLTLQHGLASGANGKNGAAGASGTVGADGKDGGTSSAGDCSPSGNRGADGGPGSAAKPGGKGGDGIPATAGGSASGGALLISAAP